jgi:hypothetical protein
MNPIQRKANRVEMNSNDHRGAKGGLRRLRRLRLLTFAGVLASAAALPFAASAAGGKPSLDRPTGLQTFELRLDDSRATTGIGTPTFSRTPSFAWTPVRGATRYELELATSNYFDADNSVVWSSNSLTTPAASVPISLPWITGDPASLFWRVRASGPLGVSQWSNPSAFVMRWTQMPHPLPAGPGYVRWSTVDGATGYQVWFVNAGNPKAPVALGKQFTTITNVADEREYYLPGRIAPSGVQWRVRAERRVYGTTANGLPAVSFGPWSPVFTSGLSPATSTAGAPFQAVKAVSDVVSTPVHPQAHSLVPAFTVDGNPPAPATLYRVYVFTDRDCLNRVFTGYPVASPAYAPRSTGGAVLPTGTNRMADGTTVTPNEVAKGAPAKIDLWDNLGRYYAVAVPVIVEGQKHAASPAATSKSAGATIVYQDIVLPQDVCQAGHFITFGKSSSAPVVTADGHPTATGLSPSGRLLASASWMPSFYGSPLVTWQPASGAVGYEVQWSKSAYPWRTAGSMRTAATSAMLPLRPGSWWYRVRGIDPSLPGNGLMTWSAQVPLVVTPPIYGVVGG